MPSFQDLPLEIRQEIYAIALTSPEEFTIWTGSHQSKDIISRTTLSDHQVPSVIDVALTRVSKQIRAEALPVLYGFNNFSFTSSPPLELFLTQIGIDRKYLRHVRIHAGGYQRQFDLVFKATRRAFRLLELAGGLQSLTVSHVDFCCGKIDMENFADACSPLLKTLKYARKRDEVKGNVFGIVKFQLMECQGCGGCSLRGKQNTSRRIVGEPRSHLAIRCRCQCTEAETNNKGMEEQFKRVLAEKPSPED